MTRADEREPEGVLTEPAVLTYAAAELAEIAAVAQVSTVFSDKHAKDRFAAVDPVAVLNALIEARIESFDARELREELAYTGTAITTPTIPSDRNIKDNLREVRPLDILSRLARR